jgi:hypothetical protein
MRVRIYQPAKTAMQSGRAATKEWLIEPELTSSRVPEPLMGWVSANDTLIELNGKLQFANVEEAQAFAEKQGWDYAIAYPKKRRVVPRNYLDNFRWIRPQDSETR